jgi:hypothetical protein
MDLFIAQSDIGRGSQEHMLRKEKQAAAAAELGRDDQHED